MKTTKKAAETDSVFSFQQRDIRPNREVIGDLQRIVGGITETLEAFIMEDVVDTERRNVGALPLNA